MTSSQVLLHNASYIYAYFFWILSSTKMKFGQILVCCMTNSFNMFLTECWRLETSSRLFYDFIEIKIQQDLAIFNGWHIPFLIVLYSPLQSYLFLPSLGSELSLHIMLYCSKCWREVLMDVCDVWPIFSDKNPCKMFSNNLWNYGSFDT